MKPLETNKKALIWFCAFTSDETPNKRSRLAHITFTAFTIFIFISFLLASMAYFYKFFTIDLSEAFYILIQMTNALPMMNAMIIMIFLRDKFTALYESLTGIYKTYENEESFRFVAATNQKCESMWKIYIKYVVYGFIVSVISVAIMSVCICWAIKGEFDEQTVYHPYKVILPWNQQNLLGYVAEKVFDLFIGAVYFLALAVTLLLFISLCLLYQAFFEMFKHAAVKIGQSGRNESVQIEKDAKNIRELIRFHSRIKKLFFDSADIYSSFVFAQLMCSMLELACTTFQLNLQIKHPDYGIILLSQALMLGISMMFVYCYFGELANSSFENMTNALYESNWLNLPIKLQKYYIVMIGNAQQSLYYHGFHITILNLNTFAKLMKAVFTYYMALQTITEE